jgi:hypothetical protein
MRLDIIELLKKMIELEGPDVVSYEETVLVELAEEILGIEFDDILENKLIMATSLLLNDLFWTDHTVFENAILAFNEMPVVLDEYQVPYPEHIVYGIKVAERIRKSREFSENVLAYMAAAFLTYEILWVPREFAPEEVNDRIAIIARNYPEDEIEIVKGKFYANDFENLEDDVVGVQLQKLLDIKNYLKENGIE